MCKKSHKNGMHARFCAACGSDDLSEGAWAIPTGGLSRIAAWAIVAAAALWGLRHVALLACSAWDAARWCVGQVFAWNQPYSGALVRGLFSWMTLIWIVSLFLPHEHGRYVRQKMVDGLLWSGRSLRAVLRWCAVLLVALAQGAWRGRAGNGH
jgi:hypothetical protein